MDQKEKHPDGPESGKSTDQKQHSGLGQIGTSVDWEIPGDVPEEHRRSISPYAPADESVKPDLQKIAGDTPAKTVATNIPTSQSPRSTIKAHTVNTPQRRSSFPLRGLVVLLLMLGLGGLGYMYFSGEDEKLVDVSVEQVDGETAVLEDVPAVMQTVLSDAAEESPTLPDQDVQPDVADNSEAAANTVQEPRIITHVVKKGDTLWDIAEYYVNDPFRYPELAELSTIENPDLIYPGEIIRIRV